MNKTERIAFFSLAIPVWIYLGVRAVYIPLIHDEVVTYFAYMQTATFIPPWSYWDANNHLINSALGSLFHFLFGTNPFITRLASWLSFIPLIYFVFKISQKLPNEISRWMFIIPLLTTPFFIEFFSLTRGYGMSMAWFLGVIYYTILYTETKNPSHLKWISILGLLTSLSSLSVIISVFIIYGWVLLIQVLVLKKPVFKTSFKWFGVFMLPQLPLVYYVLLLKEKGLLYYGGDEFITYTLKPFARYFFTSEELWWVIIIPFGIMVMLYGIQNYKSKFIALLATKNLFLFVLFLSLVAVFAQHFLTGVNYPEDRAALYFFPLLIGAWAWLPTFNNQYLKVGFALVLLWFPLHFVSSANIQFSRLWQHEHIPTRFNETVNSHISKDGFPPTLSAYFLRYYIWDFNQLSNYVTQSTVNTTDYPSAISDFLIVDSVRIKKVDLSHYDVLDYDEVSGNSLLKNTHKFTETPFKDTVITNLEIKSEFTNIFEINTRNWENNPLVFYYDVDFKSSTDVMHLLVVCSLFDTEGKEIYRNQYHFDQVNEHWKTPKNCKIKLYFPAFPENAKRLVTYIYNPLKETHQLIQLKAKMVNISPVKTE